MSIRSMESAITSEAREYFKNRKLRLMDIQEWSTAPIKVIDGEVTEWLPFNKVYIAIKTEHDKRKKG